MRRHKDGTCLIRRRTGVPVVFGSNNGDGDELSLLSGLLTFEEGLKGVREGSFAVFSVRMIVVGVGTRRDSFESCSARSNTCR